eukprot:g8581.t1
MQLPLQQRLKASWSRLMFQKWRQEVLTPQWKNPLSSKKEIGRAETSSDTRVKQAPSSTGKEHQKGRGERNSTKLKVKHKY